MNSSMPIGFHLAQFNLARTRAPLTDPLLSDFVDLLDEINALADRSPGFVWRLQSESGNATDYEIDSGHIQVLSRRTEWFERSDTPSMVLWWVPVGALPTLEDGLARLAHLTRHGPSEHAFTFKTRFLAPSGTAARDLAYS